MDPNLYNAIIDGNEKTLEKFMGKKELLAKATPIERNTILHVAAQYKQEQIAQKILQIHDDHFPTDDHVMITPSLINIEVGLTIKAESSSADLVDTQPQSFTSSLLYKQNSNGDTALHVAASVGCLEIIKHLLNAQDNRLIQDVEAVGPNMYLTKMINLKEDTVLHLAVRKDNLDVVKFLLEKDTELATQQNKVGESALFLAIERHYLDIAKHLLFKTSNRAYGGRQGMNALHLAVVLTAKSRVSPWKYASTGLHFRATGGNDSQTIQNLKDIITGIMERESSLVTKKDNVLNWTPLHYAAYYDVHVVNDLLRLISDENNINYEPLLEKDKNGMSALHIAAANGSSGVLSNLISKFPLLCELLNNHDQTVLHVAVESGQEEIVYRLLSLSVIKNSEAFINKQDKDGNTALHLAATWEERGILQMLLRNKNVDRNIVNNKGLTIYDLSMKYWSWRLNGPGLYVEFKSWVKLPFSYKSSWMMTSLRSDPKRAMSGLEKNLARIESEMKFYEFEKKSEEKKETKVKNKQNLEEADKESRDLVANYKADDDLESKREELRRKRLKSKNSSSHLLLELGQVIANMFVTNSKVKKATENDMLIATIIATVTFAVAFQVPGGYESDGEQRGLPILRSRFGFKVFLISNCMAFGFSSCSILLHFFAAKRKGSDYYDIFLRRAIASTLYSIFTMFIAFVSAIRLISTNSKSLQLAPYICVASFLFFFLYADSLSQPLYFYSIYGFIFVILLPLFLCLAPIYCLVATIAILLDRYLHLHFLKLLLNKLVPNHFKV